MYSRIAGITSDAPMASGNVMRPRQCQVLPNPKQARSTLSRPVRDGVLFQLFNLVEDIDEAGMEIILGNPHDLNLHAMIYNYLLSLVFWKELGRPRPSDDEFPDLDMLIDGFDPTEMTPDRFQKLLTKYLILLRIWLRVPEACTQTKLIPVTTNDSGVVAYLSNPWKCHDPIYVVRAWPKLSERQRNALRILLVLAGVEQNPGPSRKTGPNSDPAVLKLVSDDTFHSLFNWFLVHMGIKGNNETYQHYVMRCDPVALNKCWEDFERNTGYFTDGHRADAAGLRYIDQSHLSPTVLAPPEFCVHLNEDKMQWEQYPRPDDQAPPGAAAQSASSPVNDRNEIVVADTQSRLRIHVPADAEDHQRPATNRDLGHRERRRDKKGLVERAKADDTAKARAIEDAKSEKIDELKARLEDQQVKEQKLIEANSSMLGQIAELAAFKSTMEDMGFAPLSGESVVGSFTFRGTFRQSLAPTYDQDGDDYVTVYIHANDQWEVDGGGVHSRVFVPPDAVTLACLSSPTEDGNLRYRNIYGALVQSKEIKALVSSASSQDRVNFYLSMQIRAFLLAGANFASGRLRWLNDVAEWVPAKYCLTTLTEEDNMYLKDECHVNFSANTMRFQASQCRNMRAAPIVCAGIIAHVPDASDMATLKAGLLKRLFPRLNPPTNLMRQELCVAADDLASRIDHKTQDAIDMNEVIAEALAGRPLFEREHIEAGIKDWQTDPKTTLKKYLAQPYKCFIKLESYVDGTFKPPRFIMTMTEWCRGVQIAAMGKILRRVEIGTKDCNVKGLTADEITAKLEKKFAHVSMVAETDFSSFESCISPIMKSVVENRIFHHLATTQEERDFIEQALGRKTVVLIGPCFSCHDFHHIRMSGDYWTSLGNLLENIVISSVCSKVSVDYMCERGLFEGDDGCYPAPKDPDMVMRRAERCGVKLTFAIADWHSLSFCGNHFEEVCGYLRRHRDPRKSLVNSTLLCGVSGQTLSKDVMLQRAKCISNLYGPWIPDANVFAACVERFTRDYEVDEASMLSMGLLKKYSGYGVEKCVPQWLIHWHGIPLTDWMFVNIVYNHNVAAGGKCPKSTIWKIVEILRGCDGHFNHVVVPSPIPVDEFRGSWYARDGLKYSHICSRFGVPETVYANVQNFDARRHAPDTVRREMHGSQSRESAHTSWADWFRWGLNILITMLTIAMVGYACYAVSACLTPVFQSYAARKAHVSMINELRRECPVGNLTCPYDYDVGLALEATEVSLPVSIPWSTWVVSTTQDLVWSAQMRLAVLLDCVLPFSLVDALISDWLFPVTLLAMVYSAALVLSLARLAYRSSIAGVISFLLALARVLARVILGGWWLVCQVSAVGFSCVLVSLSLIQRLADLTVRALVWLWSRVVF